MSLDRISNMLSSVKNAAMAGNSSIETFYSKECEDIAKVLKKAGYLDDVRVFKEKGKSYKRLRIDLTREGEGFRLTEIKRISKPGRRLYTSSTEIKPVVGGSGVLVVTTSRGIMSGYEAKKKNLGGEVICRVY